MDYVVRRESDDGIDTENVKQEREKHRQEWKIPVNEKSGACAAAISRLSRQLSSANHNPIQSHRWDGRDAEPAWANCLSRFQSVLGGQGRRGPVSGPDEIALPPCRGTLWTTSLETRMMIVGRMPGASGAVVTTGGWRSASDRPLIRRPHR